jgi:hypothetical protein
MTPWFYSPDFNMFLKMIPFVLNGQYPGWPLQVPADINSLAHIVIGLTNPDPSLRWSMKVALLELNKIKKALRI